MDKKFTKERMVDLVGIPEGDEEGLYREEFRRELARRILDVLMDRDTQPSREAIEEVLREIQLKERE